jgi:hypothetical protein
VVFEGTATAAKDVDWSAPPHCVIAVHARIAEIVRRVDSGILKRGPVTCWRARSP